MGHLTLLVWIHILRPYLSARSLTWFVLLALMSPLTGPGSLIVTPDIPLLFFWSLLVWGLVRSLASLNWRWALLVGLCLGLGFVSKYTVVLFVPIAAMCFIQQKWPLKKIMSAIVVGFLGFLLTSWPVWLWNIQNEWISFGFQIDHGLGAKVWKPSWTTDYILAQIGLIFPTIIYFATRNKGTPFWLKTLAWFPLMFFFFTSFRGYAEANWPIVAYLPFIALAVWSPPQWKWARWTLGVWATCFALVLSLVAQFWLPIDKNKVKIKELYRYDVLMDFVRTQESVYARTYQMASKLSFELKRPIYKLRGVNRFDFFDLRAESLPSQNMFWYIGKPGDHLPQSSVQGYNKIEVRDLGEGFEAWRFEKE